MKMKIPFTKSKVTPPPSPPAKLIGKFKDLQNKDNMGEALAVEDYKSFFEALGKDVISSATNAKGDIIYVNDRFVEVSQYSRRELLGQNHRIVKSGFHPPEFYKALWNTISSGHVWRGEIKNQAKDGSYYWVDTSIAPVLGADGKPEKYVSVRFLITEKKQAEEALVQSVEQLAQASAQKQASSQYARSLIEASLDPLVTISTEGKITDLNEASAKVTGMPREKLIGADFSNCFTEPDKAREGYQQVFAKGFVTDYPLTIRHKDGRLTDVLYNASVYKDAAGNVLGVFAAARDVTAQKKAETEVAEQRQVVEQRQKELERLAELERFQKLTVGRELKMVELKKEIEELKREVGAKAGGGR